MKTASTIILFLFLSNQIFAEVIDAKRSKLDDQTAQIRLHSIDPELNLPFTSETKRLLDVYTYSYLPGARRIVKRSNPYFSQYDHVLEKKGLPKVLKNIAIVESNMDPWTFSSRGAVGVWQLMRTTAKSHGLVIDKYVDERFDPMLASNVAFDYLKELYEEFGDWNLTLVAYNFGPSALRKAMRSCGSKEYDVLKNHLPKESVKYSSRLAAAAYLTQYYSEHLRLREPMKENVMMAGIPVYDYITFNEIAQKTGLSRQEIIEYNPAITYDYIPSNNKGYTINLPIEAMMIIISDKGWDARDIANFDYHQSQIEALLPFCSNFDINQTDQNEQEQLPGDSLSDILALRREQILRMLSLS